jgi:hypothetical protein
MGAEGVLDLQLGAVLRRDRAEDGEELVGIHPAGLAVRAVGGSAACFLRGETLGAKLAAGACQFVLQNLQIAREQRKRAFRLERLGLLQKVGDAHRMRRRRDSERECCGYNDLMQMLPPLAADRRDRGFAHY